MKIWHLPPPPVPTTLEQHTAGGEARMAWQEWIFVVGNFGQSVMLLPMLRAPEKPPLKSSLPLAVTLASFSFAFATLTLWLSALAVGVASAGWFLLVYQ